MKATACLKISEWLKTADPVVSLNKSMPSELVSSLRTALRNGVHAIADHRRSGFYDVEIEDRWYYIHIPERLARVYLVAIGGYGITSLPTAKLS